ncbi:MAG: transglutaminase domain-containing protein [Bacteroidota bacterium]
MQGYLQPTIAENKQAADAISINTSESSGLTNATTISSNQIHFMRNDFRWVVENAPALKEEPKMNNRVDYISKINFELTFQRMPNGKEYVYLGTWDGINDEYLNHPKFGRALNANNFLSGITENIIAPATNPQEKIEKIFDYVRTNVVWNGLNRSLLTNDLKSALDEKKGNAADMNLLLVAMLRKAGLVADPVVISTRNHGFIRKQTPLSKQFNYVICMITLNEESNFPGCNRPITPNECSPGALPQW